MMLFIITILFFFFIFLNKNFKKKIHPEGFENQSKNQNDNQKNDINENQKNDINDNQKNDINDNKNDNKNDDIESVDKNRKGCFRRKDSVIITKSEYDRFTDRNWKAKGSIKTSVSTKGEKVQGTMCNEKWGMPECVEQEPSQTIETILDSPKINPFRGYRQNPHLYSLDYIEYLTKEPIPIHTTFFS